MPWPPRKGELLPRFDEAFGIEQKLRDYSLAPAHEGGKARDFFACLRLDLSEIDYLEQEIRRGISLAPIRSVRTNSFGFHCAVQFPIAGPGDYSHRTAPVRTVWQLVHRESRPRLITAYPIGRNS
jgi:hypothetical protein